MINKIWSALTMGKTFPTGAYTRKTDPTPYREPTGTVLRTLRMLSPYRDELFQSFRVDQLVQLLMRSPFSPQARVLDPINTYQRAHLVFPEVGEVPHGVPSGLRVVFQTEQSTLLARGNGTPVFHYTVDVGAKTVTYLGDTEPFTFVNGLSSHIVFIPGLSFRFSGALPGGDFSMTHEYVARTSMDWQTLLLQADAMDHNWENRELFDTWRSDVDWSRRLSALILSTAEQCLA